MERFFSLTNEKGSKLFKTNMIGEKDLIERIKSEENPTIGYRDNNLNRYVTANYNYETGLYNVRNNSHEVTADHLVKMIYDRLKPHEWDNLKLEEDFPKVIPYFCKIHHQKEQANFDCLLKFPGFGQLSQYKTPSEFSFNLRDMLDISRGKKDKSWWEKYEKTCRN